MKASEIRAMTSEELEKKLKELKNELFNLRFQHAINQLDNPHKIGVKVWIYKGEVLRDSGKKTRFAEAKIEAPKQERRGDRRDRKPGFKGDRKPGFNKNQGNRQGGFKNNRQGAPANKEGGDK